MRTLLLLILAGCAACTTAAPPAPQGPQAQASPPSAAAPADRSADTLARIRALAGSASCSSDAQCHTLPLGARPCGGPDSYLPWSSAQTSQAEIQALGERYKEERRAVNKATGAVSTCQYLMDPGAVCRAGACVLGTVGPLPAR